MAITVNWTNIPRGFIRLNNKTVVRESAVIGWYDDPDDPDGIVIMLINRERVRVSRKAARDLFVDWGIVFPKG